MPHDLYEYEFSKPASLDAYKLHQMVEGLVPAKAPEERILFRDNGDKVHIRCTKPELNGLQGTLTNVPTEGEIRIIELRAVCYLASGRKKVSFETRDWKSRHNWLERKGNTNGFEPLTTTVSSSSTKISKPSGEFVLDRSDFAACIRITDAQKFREVLANGLGSRGRAFGFGMIVI